MREYIVNLTNHIINGNHYDEIWERMGCDPEAFLRHITISLEVGPIANMTYETLGKIMGNLDVGDVSVGKLNLEVGFNGSCGDFLRSVVARCLAYVIRDRLNVNDPDRPTDFPLYCSSHGQSRWIQDSLNQKSC